MKKWSTYLIICVAVLTLLPCLALAETKSGDVTLKKGRDLDEPPTVTLGTKVIVSCHFHTDDFFHQSIINGTADLENKSDKPMYYSYNVAFFDKDHHLIGCVSQGSMSLALKPGEKTQLGSCLIFVPAAEIAKVTSFQVTWYESPNKGDL